MAEFAVAGVLSVYKRLPEFREQQKKHEWKKIREIRELAGKRVVIVGCGSVGTECAKRFKAFGCEVIGVDIFVRDDENYDDIRNLESLDDALQSQRPFSYPPELKYGNLLPVPAWPRERTSS